MKPTVACKSTGFDNIDDCENHTCDSNAKCIDGINGYTCECDHKFDPVGNSCVPVIPVNECDLGQHNCHDHATCKDAFRQSFQNCRYGIL